MNWSKYWTENTGSRNSLDVNVISTILKKRTGGTAPEVELEDAGDRVDIGGVGHVGRGVVPALKCLSEVVDLHLK